MKGDPESDPKGLIFEAYRIEGITEAECRTIFLDWAIGLPDGWDARSVLPLLIARHAEPHPDHPMSAVLRAGLASAERPRRRGGREGRR